jgi:hypothetical protein
VNQCLNPKREQEQEKEKKNDEDGFYYCTRLDASGLHVCVCVRESVRESVREDVRESVREDVRESVRACARVGVCVWGGGEENDDCPNKTDER